MCAVCRTFCSQIFLLYVDSAEFGNGTFKSFFERELAALGVVDTEKYKGTALTRAARANQEFILEQRAEMRARLVQAAVDETLKHGPETLGGMRVRPEDRAALTELDEESEDDEQVGFHTGDGVVER